MCADHLYTFRGATKMCSHQQKVTDLVSIQFNCMINVLCFAWTVSQLLFAKDYVIEFVLQHFVYNEHPLFLLALLLLLLLLLFNSYTRYNTQTVFNVHKQQVQPSSQCCQLQWRLEPLWQRWFAVGSFQPLGIEPLWPVVLALGSFHLCHL